VQDFPKRSEKHNSFEQLNEETMRKRKHWWILMKKRNTQREWEKKSFADKEKREWGGKNSLDYWRTTIDETRNESIWYWTETVHCI